ncbi:MAG: sodium:solute symporter [Pirellulales bacterium]|nr:sodium:solute symporter [Pirellulales bacterium]
MGTFAVSTGRLPLHPVDIAVVALYLLAMLAVGVWVGRGQKTTKDYFLGDRSLPWWAVLLSIVATETSTVTFLSIPGMAYAAGGDLRFLQITFGYIVGRTLVMAVLLPLYFRGEPFTAYEVLQRRFGRLSRRATSLLFLITRNLSDALRLYLSALVLQAAMGLDLPTSIVVMGVVTLVYTYIGGVKSVIWNDCVQFAIYIVGACLALNEIIAGLPGGMAQFRQFALEHDKLRVFDFDLSLVKPTMTFWAGLVGGAFLTGATHGADQLTVQRLLTARSQRGAALALVASGVVVCLQFALFLVIGVGLAAFFAAHPEGASQINSNDQAFAYYIVHYLRPGFVGLTLAAVFSAAMSTLSGSLNSSATALVKDFIIPLRRQPLSETAELNVSRLATGLFGVLQIGIALASHLRSADQSVVQSVLSIAAFTSGPMLGLYLLAVLTPRVREPAALAGFGAGLALLAYMEFSTWPSWPVESLRWPAAPVYWLWYATIGSLVTLAVGWSLSLSPLNTTAADIDPS